MLYAIGSEMAKDMHLKFGRHALRDRPNMTSENVFEKERGQDHVAP